MGEAALFTYGQGNVLPAEFLEQEISATAAFEKEQEDAEAHLEKR